MKNKVVIITGGAQGIGFSIAKGFAKKGAIPIIWDINQDILDKATTKLKEFSPQVESHLVDITDIVAVESCVKEIHKKYKKIDILINNAGVTADALIIKMDYEKWKRVININLNGTFICSQKIGRIMLKQRFGSIVNISSVIGLMGNIGQANYAASKGGIISLTKSCAKEFAGRGVRVNAIAPGFIETAMTKILPENVVESYSKMIPLKKMGKPKDVADLCLFLGGEKANYITGQVIKLDGGLLM